MKILIIDNYDSFTYNLVHYVQEITGVMPDVYRNDQISLTAVASYDLLMLSPGPGIPKEAGILKDIVRHYARKKPIFGVCLGLQAIVEVFDGEIMNMEQVYHGVATEMTVVDFEAPVFSGIPEKFEAGRYHSWAANRNKIPKDLIVTCVDAQGMVMGVRHRKYPISAVQFHPESILTPKGKKMVANFIEYYQRQNP